ncbi:hypothetical protein FTUN_6740 [Frigoriglobus tundricola]|uniref:Uncharacterized protein n=1 Tax=Frigoriglobus tundricola TaxID=2774151 RepID=A0A6M5Z0I0_9BACT|nr:hypothetical protein FTUN_6740 [Frigoriglobus tundricola]
MFGPDGRPRGTTFSPASKSGWSKWAKPDPVNGSAKPSTNQQPTCAPDAPMVRAINPNATLESLTPDITEIGYSRTKRPKPMTA